LLFKIYAAAVLKIRADLSFTMPQRKKEKGRERAVSKIDGTWYMAVPYSWCSQQHAESDNI